MAGLVRQQERSLERERTLSSAGAALVGATGREEIEEVAVESARALAGPDSAAVVVAAGAVAEADDALVRSTPARASASGSPRSYDRALPCRHDPAPRRAAVLLVVRPGGRPTPSVQAALRALATQIALALDSAALSEEVHRRRSEARFGSLVQHSSDLITVLGPDGHVNYQSPSVERVLGYTPEEVLGTRVQRPGRGRRPRPPAAAGRGRA